jgi:hypothetical protein
VIDEGKTKEGRERWDHANMYQDLGMNRVLLVF